MRTIRTTEPGWRGALVLWLAITPWTASTLRAQGPSDSSATAGTPSGTDSGGAPTTITRPEAPASPEAAGSLVSAPEGPPKQQPTIPPAPTPLLLNRALKRQDSPVRVFGWIENSFTGNTNGTPPGRSNFGVFPNHLANSWQGNQYYFVVEDPLNQVDTVNFGFRLDTLFGNDWQFTKAYGLFDRAFPTNHFAGLDLPQLYGEVHLPVLTPWGLDIRGGRFYSLTGFESPQAIARPLLSVPYSLNFTPFTFFGVVSALCES